MQDPTTRLIGDLIPTIGGSGAHPWQLRSPFCRFPGAAGIAKKESAGTREEPGTLTHTPQSGIHSKKKIGGARGRDAGIGDEGQDVFGASRIHCFLKNASRSSVHEGAPVFPGSSRLGIEPKTTGWLVQDPTTRLGCRVWGCRVWGLGLKVAQRCKHLVYVSVVLFL